MVLDQQSLMEPGGAVDQIKNAKWLLFLAGFFPVAGLPYLHIGIIHLHFWVPEKKQINRTTCRNGCFDSVFKGSYEEPGNNGYKHVYFNATGHTLTIWVLTLLFVILGYESFKRLVTLCLSRRIRLGMLALFLVNIYPNYYTWWSYFNYLNDEFHLQLYHQLFFTVTEFISTYIVLLLCDKRFSIVPWHVYVIVGTSITHMIVGSLDQFVSHLVFSEEQFFKKVRDIAFLIPDVLSMVIPIFELRVALSNRGNGLKSLLQYRGPYVTLLLISLVSGFMTIIL